MKLPKILVLLSSWNGEQFISEQLRSILSQQIDAELQILIRDDGSTDRTITLVKAIDDSRITLIEGNNIGVKASFLQLLGQAAELDPDFVALADQDDVWHPEKLAVAVDRLAETEVPALYCSALELVDGELSPLGLYVAKEHIGFRQAVFSNIATGCTCVMNRALLDKTHSAPDPDNILMHDWWIYMVSAAFGQVFYDETAHISYRQHGGNQIGLKVGLLAYWHRFMKFLKRPTKPNRISQAREFLELYGTRITGEQRQFLIELERSSTNIFNRLLFAYRQRPRRKNLINDVIGSVVFILGR